MQWECVWEREFNIIYKLLSYPGKTFTRTQLMDEFWDAETNTAPRAVDVYMTKLRGKVEGAEKLMRGDLSTRIEPFHGIDSESEFNIIIDYFNRMAKELDGLETLRTDFIANVSHELKTPLAVMQNYSMMLQSPNLSEEQRIEYAKAVAESSRRLASLITNILKLNRLENQQICPAAKAINFVAALVSILSLETAMLSQFGGNDDPMFRKVMTGATGGGVCTIVIGMAIYMIRWANKELKRKG